jgi:hypothetical protein
MAHVPVGPADGFVDMEGQSGASEVCSALEGFSRTRSLYVGAGSDFGAFGFPFPPCFFCWPGGFPNRVSLRKKCLHEPASAPGVGFEES